MAYYFYKTSHRLHHKTKELQNELLELENRFEVVSQIRLKDEEFAILLLELDTVRTKLKYFSAAISNEIWKDANNEVKE